MYGLDPGLACACVCLKAGVMAMGDGRVKGDAAEAGDAMNGFESQRADG
jgi:hypothetical protein